MSETLTRIFFEFLSLSKNLLVLFIGITLFINFIQAYVPFDKLEKLMGSKNPFIGNLSEPSLALLPLLLLLYSPITCHNDKSKHSVSNSNDILIYFSTTWSLDFRIDGLHIWSKNNSNLHSSYLLLLNDYWLDLR